VSSVYDPVEVSKTVVTTYYVDICPTGLTTVPYTYTATRTPGAKPPAKAYDSSYFTTTVAVYKNSDAYPVTVTLTKPIEAAKTPVKAVGMPGSAAPYPSGAAAKPVAAPVNSNLAAAVAKPASQAPGSYPSAPAAPVEPASQAPPYNPSAPAAPVYGASSLSPIYTTAAALGKSTPVAPVYNAVGSTKVPLVGTETYGAPYAKFTGGAGKEMVTLGGVLAAVALVLFL
jgi:chitinase